VTLSATLETHIDRAAMRMWEWFDMWALLQEMQRHYPADVLLMEAEDDHEEMLKHLKDVQTDHRHMSPEESAAPATDCCCPRGCSCGDRAARGR